MTNELNEQIEEETKGFITKIGEILGSTKSDKEKDDEKDDGSKKQQREREDQGSGTSEKELHVRRGAGRRDRRAGQQAEKHPEK